MEDINLQEILDEIDSNQFKEDEYGTIVTISLERLRAIVSTGEDYRKTLYAKNVIGLPKYVQGDCVGIIGMKRTFHVHSASVMDHPDYGYTWTYRMGAYFVPEQDLELITPRGVAKYDRMASESNDD